MKKYIMMSGLISLIGVKASDAMTTSSLDSWEGSFQCYVTNSDNFSNFVKTMSKEIMANVKNEYTDFLKEKMDQKMKESEALTKLFKELVEKEKLNTLFEELAKTRLWQDKFKELVGEDESLKEANIDDFITYLDTEFCDPGSLNGAALEYFNGMLNEAGMDLFFDFLEERLLEEKNEIEEKLNESEILSISSKEEEKPKKRPREELNKNEKSRINTADADNSTQKINGLGIKVAS